MGLCRELVGGRVHNLKKHRIESDVKCKVPLKGSMDLLRLAHQLLLCSAGTQALEHFVLARWRLILRNLAQIVWHTLNVGMHELPRLPSRLKWKNFMELFPFARLEHVSFSYNRLEDEVCSSVVRLLLGHCCESLWGSMVQMPNSCYRWCWRLMGYDGMCFRRRNANVNRHIQHVMNWENLSSARRCQVGWILLFYFIPKQLCSATLSDSACLFLRGLPPTLSWSSWNWTATAWAQQLLRSWWRALPPTRPCRSPSDNMNHRGAGLFFQHRQSE